MNLEGVEGKNLQQTKPNKQPKTPYTQKNTTFTHSHTSNPGSITADYLNSSLYHVPKEFQDKYLAQLLHRFLYKHPNTFLMILFIETPIP